MNRGYLSNRNILNSIVLEFIRTFPEKCLYVMMINYLNQTISQANATGLLVVDNNRKIVSLNRKFIDIWGLPSQIVREQDEKLALEFAYSQVKNPHIFIKEIQEIYIHIESEISDIIKFKDGRLFKRTSQPQYLKDKIVGRIWTFREITQWSIEQELDIIKNKIFLFPHLG